MRRGIHVPRGTPALAVEALPAAALEVVAGEVHCSRLRHLRALHLQYLDRALDLVLGREDQGIQISSARQHLQRLWYRLAWLQLTGLFI